MLIKNFFTFFTLGFRSPDGLTYFLQGKVETRRLVLSLPKPINKLYRNQKNGLLWELSLTLPHQTKYYSITVLYFILVFSAVLSL